MPMIPSPDGTMQLVTSIPQKANDPDYHCLVFEIRDIAGKVLHRQNTGAKVSGWSVGWGSNTRIFVYASDIGTCHWSKQTNGALKKNNSRAA
jgi:hypothetical protein